MWAAAWMPSKRWLGASVHRIPYWIEMGFFKVNSLHHQGLKEAQRAPRLMTTAYQVEDGLIEGLESPEHSWVIGVQCHPERQDEVPKLFGNLFLGLHERAENYISEFAA